MNNFYLNDFPINPLTTILISFPSSETIRLLFQIALVWSKIRVSISYSNCPAVFLSQFQNISEMKKLNQ